jgi:hypothetical protein
VLCKGAKVVRKFEIEREAYQQKTTLRIQGMTAVNDTKIHIFTDETLRNRDLEIATKVHQASVKSTTRKLLKMNPGQQLNAARNDSESLLWSSDQLKTVLDHIE